MRARVYTHTRRYTYTTTCVLCVEVRGQLLEVSVFFSSARLSGVPVPAEPSLWTDSLFCSVCWCA